MNANVWVTLGGIGVFLVGMTLLSDGLRSLAGEALRRALATLTTSPWAGVGTGAVVTALLHSSSATTLMAVGFVGAGLLSFPQAMGVILGANIGTTATGWFVAILGFRWNSQALTLSSVLVGALLWRFGRGRWSSVGMALAGFGLVFVGIASLRLGMEGLSAFLRPEHLLPNTWLGRAGMVLIGLLLTVVTQSSTVGVATTLAAVHAHSITVSQAGALVIGMDVGTTVTAALAVIGGNVHVRRTGLGQVVFNVITGCAAFLGLPWYVALWQGLAPATLGHHPEIAVVGFHSLFNVVGVAVVVPWLPQFTGWIERLFPARTSDLTRRLDPRLWKAPSTALDAVNGTLDELTQFVMAHVPDALRPDGDHRDWQAALAQAELCSGEVRRYVAQIPSVPADARHRQRLADTLHAVDHLVRLVARCRRTDRLHTVQTDPELQRLAAAWLATAVADGRETVPREEQLAKLRTGWQRLEESHDPFRRESIARSIDGADTTEQTLARLDAHRWLRRISHHRWSIAFYLAEPAQREFAEIAGGQVRQE